MRLLRTALYMSLRTFTALPLPEGEWDEKLRRLSGACLPVVGLVLGMLWWAISALAALWLPKALAAALTAALPFLLTGFIHLDGFMDTSDAMLSWRDREARLRILKDVHVGSFAVVMLGLLFMFQLAACLSVEKRALLIPLMLLSRSGSALSVLLLPPLGHSEYAADDKASDKSSDEASDRTSDGASSELALPVCAMALIGIVLAILLGGWTGLAVAVAVLGSYAFAMWRCVGSLGGMSGDLCGFALTVSEVCGLIALAIF